MLKTITTTMMLAGSLTFAATASAQFNQGDQPPSQPRVAPQSAGGNGSTTLWAFIQADGSHSSDAGLGLASSAKLATGQYEVIFKRFVNNNCSFSGGMSHQSSATDHGFIYLVRRSTNNKGVFVRTQDATGTNADRNFGVLVTCYR